MSERERAGMGEIRQQRGEPVIVWLALQSSGFLMHIPLPRTTAHAYMLSFPFLISALSKRSSDSFF